MLTRRYVLNTDTLFLISNGCEFGSLRHGLWSILTESELQSPSLRIELADDSKRDWFFSDACIRYPEIISGVRYEPINLEIRQALLGESDSWKITRCSAGYDTERRANVFFMLINAELYRQYIQELAAEEEQYGLKRKNGLECDSFDLGNDYSDLECGRVFVYLKPPKKCHLCPQHFRVNYVKSMDPTVSPHQSIEVVSVSGVDIVATEQCHYYSRQTSTCVRRLETDGSLICCVHEDWI